MSSTSMYLPLATIHEPTELRFRPMAQVPGRPRGESIFKLTSDEPARDAVARLRRVLLTDGDDAATRFTLGQIEDWLFAGRCTVVEDFLGGLKPSELPAQLILGVLALTRFETMKSSPKRQAFLTAAEHHLASKHDAATVERWLKSRR